MEKGRLGDMRELEGASGHGQPVLQKKLRPKLLATSVHGWDDRGSRTELGLGRLRPGGVVRGITLKKWRWGEVR